MTTLTLPPPDEMYGALLRRDATYDGVFFTGVRTTDIFCKPLEPTGRAPEWLEPLLERLEGQPSQRWRDSDLREIGVDPNRVRRWFKQITE